MSITASPFESFREAFAQSSAGCRRTCECGREFYNSDGGWTWEHGELEGLKKAGATDLPHAVQCVVFEGKEYVIDCLCWHERAGKVIGWLRQHDDQIAAFLTFEKARKQREADDSPVVK